MHLHGRGWATSLSDESEPASYQIGDPMARLANDLHVGAPRVIGRELAEQELGRASDHIEGRADLMRQLGSQLPGQCQPFRARHLLGDPLALSNILGDPFDAQDTRIAALPRVEGELTPAPAAISVP